MTDDDKRVDSVPRDSLGRYPKGVSGNPGGKVSGTKSFSAILRKLLKNKNLDDIDVSTLDLQDKLMLDLIKAAQGAESLRALEMLVDRVDGKPQQTQKIDLTSNKSPFEVFTDGPEVQENETE